MCFFNVRPCALEKIAKEIGEDVEDGFSGGERRKLACDLLGCIASGTEMKLEPVGGLVEKEHTQDIQSNHSAFIQSSSSAVS